MRHKIPALEMAGIAFANPFKELSTQSTGGLVSYKIYLLNDVSYKNCVKSRESCFVYMLQNRGNKNNLLEIDFVYSC